MHVQKCLATYTHTELGNMNWSNGATIISFGKPIDRRWFVGFHFINLNNGIGEHTRLIKLSKDSLKSTILNDKIFMRIYCSKTPKFV